jgi:hypothetical protein
MVTYSGHVCVIGGREYARQFGHDSRLVSSQSMVPNPIYDSPMYESIQQYPSNSSPNVSTDTECRYTVNDTTHTHYENTACPPSISAPVEPDLTTLYAEHSYTASPTVPRALPAGPKTSKERNTLHLTLTLNAGEDEAHLSPMETGRSGIVPLSSAVPDYMNDENYTLMSPFGKSHLVHKSI